MIKIEQDENIYLYNNYSERIVQKWSHEEFVRLVLENEDVYEAYLSEQNLTLNDTYVIHGWEGYRREILRASSFAMHISKDWYRICDIRNLKADWERNRKIVNEKPQVDEFSYMDHANFRNGPLKKGYRYKDRYCEKRSFKHTRVILNEIARYDEDRAAGCKLKSRKKLNEYPALDWDWYPRSRRNSRSWKDQSKKKKQWM